MIIGGGGSSYKGPKEIKYLFVDGGYFRKVVEDFGRHFYDDKNLMPSINFERLKNPHHPPYTKVFYYDCPIPQKNGESKEEHRRRRSEQKDLFDSIRFLDGFHLFEGTTTGRPGKNRQKQVDVKIAVDMLAHTYSGNMHQCTLMAGDLDFKPVVDALVMAGMYVTLWYKKGSTSRELLYASDAKIELDYHQIYYLLEDGKRNEIEFPNVSRQQVPDKLGENTRLAGLINNSGEKIEIHCLNDRFFIIEPDPKQQNNMCKTYSCGDRGILFHYYDVLNGKVNWPLEIESN